MEKPPITITIPSYNHAPFIEYALDSILKEDYPDKTILIIDDGSTDNSVELIQKWIDKNKEIIAVHFIHRSNKGLAYTINEILDNIKTDYFAWLASDDAFCNNGLSRRMDVMLQTKKMLVVGDCNVIDNDGRVTHSSWMKDVMKIDVSRYKTEEGIMREILVNPAISGSVLLINKKVYDKIGKYPANFFAEDIYFYQRCAAKKYIVYIDEIVSEYRRHDTNTSGNDLVNNKRINKSIIKSYWLNWWLFPGIYMKGLALKQWLRWKYSYLRAHVISKKV